MLREDLHISDQELLLAADGELSARRAAQVHTHLEACWNCRARMAEMEGVIVDYARAHSQAFNPQLPPVAGPRALLRARLTGLASTSRTSFWRWLPRFSFAAAATAICVALFTAILAGAFHFQHFLRSGADSGVALLERGVVPDRGLTPGATREVTISDVCSMEHEEVVREVSISLSQKIFQEYGIANAHAGDYEIDYLIAPGLGGTEDIHNLWPEPYRSRVWNASVKDELEEHLHQLVCAREVDLQTAQNDIASDWIAAYKKYFHTDMPLSLDSRLSSEDILPSAATSPEAH
jgi:hypothetical protein